MCIYKKCRFLCWFCGHYLSLQRRRAEGAGSAGQRWTWGSGGGGDTVDTWLTADCTASCFIWCVQWDEENSTASDANGSLEELQAPLKDLQSHIWRRSWQMWLQNPLRWDEAFWLLFEERGPIRVNKDGRWRPGLVVRLRRQTFSVYVLTAGSM